MTGHLRPSDDEVASPPQPSGGRGRARRATGDFAEICSLTLEAKTTAAKTGVHNNSRTDYGSYEKRYNRTRDVEISLRNIGGVPYDVVVPTTFCSRSQTPIPRARSAIESGRTFA